MMMTDAGGFGHGGGFIGINSFVIRYADGYSLIALSNVDGGAYVAVDKIFEMAGVKPKAGG